MELERTRQFQAPSTETCGPVAIEIDGVTQEVFTHRFAPGQCICRCKKRIVRKPVGKSKFGKINLRGGW